MADAAKPHGKIGEGPEKAHERTDVNILGIFWFIAILAASAVVIHVALWGLFVYLDKTTHPEEVTYWQTQPLNQVPPQPRLQASPKRDMQEMLAHERQWLNSYDWIDRQAGIVRIPIDQAMQLVTERGLDVISPQQETEKAEHQHETH